MTRVLLVDPSARGGIAAYTARVSEALALAGSAPTVLVNEALGPDPGGAERVLRWLPDAPWGRPRGPAAAFYARRAGHVARSVAAVLRAVREVRPDVVHLQFGVSRQLDALLVSGLSRRVPVVWTAHDVVPFEGEAGPARRALRRADAVIVHSRPAQDVLLAEGIASCVVAHPPASVPAGVDVTAPRSQARRQLGLPLEGRLLGALGFVRPYKGYELLAQTWEELGEAAPRLLVMGEAWGEEDHRTLARLARHERIEVRSGYAGDEELARAAHAVDAVLLPHVHASDSGLLHLAHAVGTPVLASDVPQLAAAVASTGAGAVLPRTTAAWAAAVSGPLPPAPPPPPTLAATGEAHLAVYERVSRSRRLRRLRVVLYSDARSWGGAEAVAAGLVASWSPAVDVVVVGTDAAVVEQIAADRSGAETAVLAPVRGKRDVAGARAHLRVLRRLRPDVVLVNLQVPWAGQYALAAAELLRLPVVAVEHCPLPTTSRVQRVAKRLTSSRLAAHVSVSRAAARETERVGGLRAGSVRTIPNGVVRREPAPAQLPEGVQRPCVVAVGRLDVVKGFDVLLRALVDVPQASLWLLGDGDELLSLKRLAVDLGVDGRVRFEGWCPEPGAALAAADVVVVPSRWESSALVAVEALQAGVALVVSDVGGLPELVGDAAVLVPPDDPAALAAAVRSLLADEGRRAELAARGPQVAALLPTTEDMAAAYELLLREVSGRSHHDS